MNYKIETISIIEVGISETDEPVDNCYVFSTFRSAKSAILKWLKNKRLEIDLEIESIKRMRKQDIA